MVSLFQISYNKKNDAGGVAAVRTEPQVSSPISVDGPLDETLCDTQETKADIPFKNLSYEVRKTYIHTTQ